MSYTTEKLEYLKATKLAIKNAIISKGQNVTDSDTFRSYAEKVAAIEGSSDDVRYVTFMSDDGSIEYGKLPVAAGYDCPNPKFSVTKESDAQYNYTLAGWATTPNGGLDASALKAVEKDRTVYANFVAVLRSYTITFLDTDGSVLTMKTFAYGSIPSYTPTKDGYDFVSWNPEPVAVTGDASYTAVWKVKATFGTATWAEISAITNAGTSADNFAVGDTRSEVLTYSDGTTEEIELVIAKIRDNGTMVLAFNHALATLKQMNSTMPGSGNYFTNDLGKYITETIEPTLSDDFSAVIRPVYVGFGDHLLRLPSTYNVGGTATSTDAQYEGLPLFATASNRIRTRKADGVAVTYWLSDFESTGSTYYGFGYVYTNGNIVSPANGMGAVQGLTGERGVVLLVDV